ncbi:L-serine ammonia-lyase [Bifidobacterium avesanii]|uniref:L-serine dehydratase n=1 Tax=Bifidobacterium avesanii TaxID=1798157 RepID=A0A7K3TH14_9BIFI|nr:L-serine ammonia-lyase [Bifidobacterium avesanii]KAB8292773.1 serine ammonia-lyase [Bifidobacterium avesanii]NEG78381.1 L-serine ammonia-lyase [Bifidobacterium avesanii]
MLSVLDMFSIGVGPSSSHTVGPMRAAAAFACALRGNGILDDVARVKVTLYGSLASTGLGHGTDRAVMAGLEGSLPVTVDTDDLLRIRERVARYGALRLAGSHDVPFDYDRDIVFERWITPRRHPNGMRFEASAADGRPLADDVWFSVGGGFIQQGVPADLEPAGDDDGDAGRGDAHGETSGASEAGKAADPGDTANPGNAADPVNAAAMANGTAKIDLQSVPVPYPFDSAEEMLAICAREGISIAELVRRNEVAMLMALGADAEGADQELRADLLTVWRVMRECVHNGCTSGQRTLPGGLDVPRRAPKLYARFTADPLDPRGPSGPGHSLSDRASAVEWVDLFALAVSEENAGGGRIVTAPTNGSAGIIPAVLHYYWLFADNASEDGVIRFLLTAGAVGMLFKRNASISGAEVGCQGEVGSACSMAAAGMCAVLGGTPEQVENAAEIGIEHNLGLTCDPIGGLVQIPCIERNAMAANTAINAARMAMLGDGSHVVSLDQAIRTMKQTGADMMSKYKETSQGGLAVNVVEC